MRRRRAPARRAGGSTLIRRTISSSSAGVGIVDEHLHEEPVALRFGQRVHALALDRVLRGEHEEGVGDEVRDAADRHVALGHHLEQRRLHLRRSPVDLVGQDDVGEHRAELDVEALASTAGRCGCRRGRTGTRSGVNWMRANVPPHGAPASVSAASVLASPGAPSRRQWPRASRHTKSRSIMRSWPTMICLTSNRARSRRAEASATVVESVGSKDTALLAEGCRNGRLYVARANLDFGTLSRSTGLCVAHCEAAKGSDMERWRYRSLPIGPDSHDRAARATETRRRASEASKLLARSERPRGRVSRLAVSDESTREAVAHARLGEEVAGAARLGLELAAHVGHVHPEVVRSRRGTRDPTPPGAAAAATRASPGCARAPRRGATRSGVRRISSSPPRRTRFAARSIVKSGVSIDRLLLGRRGAAERGAQAGQQLVHAERLGHVVVGPGVERRHLVALAVAHREHDDRHRAPAAQPADHVDAVDARAGRGRGPPRRGGGAPRASSACSPSGARSTS